jgi:hypothetical protein
MIEEDRMKVFHRRGAGKNFPIVIGRLDGERVI